MAEDVLPANHHQILFIAVQDDIMARLSKMDSREMLRGGSSGEEGEQEGVGGAGESIGIAGTSNSKIHTTSKCA